VNPILSHNLMLPKATLTSSSLENIFYLPLELETYYLFFSHFGRQNKVLRKRAKIINGIINS
jgi:hypothetical protein